MREIKFRFWQKDYFGKYEMTYNPFILEPDNRYREYAGVADLNKSILNEIEEGVVVMQFTGLKDKNGKEIYEGDILRECLSSLTRNIEVKFINGAFYVSKTGPYLEDALLSKCSNVEVIGNIYENPELLNNE
jgi:uncharacterized phage protein (TIGR01671 family)